MFTKISEEYEQKIRGTIRKIIQHSFHNGSTITWGKE